MRYKKGGLLPNVLYKTSLNLIIRTEKVSQDRKDRSFINIDVKTKQNIELN